MEFSVLVRNGQPLNDLWLYVLDGAPTFVSVMAFAVLFPYDLRYRAVFIRDRAPKCKRRNAESQSNADSEETVIEKMEIECEP